MVLSGCAVLSGCSTVATGLPANGGSSFDSGAPGDGGADAGFSPGFGGSGSSTGGLYILGAFGIDLVTPTTKFESAVQGLLSVQQGKGAAAQKLKDASLTINGVNVPPTSLGNFDLADASGLTIAPSSSIRVAASHGGDAAMLQVPCPADVVLTTPKDGEMVMPGESIAVAWKGTIDYQSPLFPPQLWLIEYSFARDEFAYSQLSDPQDLDATKSSATVTVPSTPTSDYSDGYLVELVVPGLRVLNDGGDTVCRLRKRVRIRTR